MSGPRKLLFLKGMVASVVVIVLAILILRRGESPRSNFLKMTGRITYLGSISPDVERVPNLKKRYLVINGEHPVFEIFIGMDPGDFSPAFQEIDSLRVGDLVDLYYDVSRFAGRNPHNNLTYFIDREGRNMFRKGASDRAAGLVLLAFGIGMIIILPILKVSKKII